MPAILEPVFYEVGPGMEDGRVCYATKNITENNGTSRHRVFATELQQSLLLFTDISVLVMILLCVIITAWNFKLELDEVRENNKHNELHVFRLNIVAEHRKRNFTKAAGIICASFVVLRLPLLIASNVVDLKLGTQFSTAIKVCGIFYIMRFSAIVILFLVTNKNYRRAFWDVIKPICPCYTLNDDGNLKKSIKRKINTSPLV